tara:strand:- start:273 stop:782 length:510 start_codon:yes stop_codon:yes gene_type:complete
MRANINIEPLIPVDADRIAHCAAFTLANKLSHAPLRIARGIVDAINFPAIFLMNTLEKRPTIFATLAIWNPALVAPLIAATVLSITLAPQQNLTRTIDDGIIPRAGHSIVLARTTPVIARGCRHTYIGEEEFSTGFSTIVSCTRPALSGITAAIIPAAIRAINVAARVP